MRSAKRRLGDIADDSQTVNCRRVRARTTAGGTAAALEQAGAETKAKTEVVVGCAVPGCEWRAHSSAHEATQHLTDAIGEHCRLLVDRQVESDQAAARTLDDCLRPFWAELGAFYVRPLTALHTVRLPEDTLLGRLAIMEARHPSGALSPLRVAASMAALHLVDSRVFSGLCVASDTDGVDLWPHDRRAILCNLLSQPLTVTAVGLALAAPGASLADRLAFLDRCASSAPSDHWRRLLEMSRRYATSGACVSPGTERDVLELLLGALEADKLFAAGFLLNTLFLSPAKPAAPLPFKTAHGPTLFAHCVERPDTAALTALLPSNCLQSLPDRRYRPR